MVLVSDVASDPPWSIRPQDSRFERTNYLVPASRKWVSNVLFVELAELLPRGVKNLHVIVRQCGKLAMASNPHGPTNDLVLEFKAKAHQRHSSAQDLP